MNWTHNGHSIVYIAVQSADATPAIWWTSQSIIVVFDSKSGWESCFRFQLMIVGAASSTKFVVRAPRLQYKLPEVDEIEKL